MTRKKPYTPVCTGVSFHPAVLAYLDRVCRESCCDRSALINHIVRKYATAGGAHVEEGEMWQIPRIRFMGRAI